MTRLAALNVLIIDRDVARLLAEVQDLRRGGAGRAALACLGAALLGDGEGDLLLTHALLACVRG